MKKPAYSLSFRAQSFGTGNGVIECKGANFVTIYLTASHVAAGVTIDGVPGVLGLNEFKCPTPDGVIDNVMSILVPSSLVPKITVRSGFITFNY